MWRAHTHTYLPIVGYSAEELEFKVKSSWIFVEQPPKAAGQVLHIHTDNILCPTYIIIFIIIILVVPTPCYFANCTLR